VDVCEDKRVNQYLSTFTHRSGVKRPDLMYDSAHVKKGQKTKVINLCEITSPWPWLKSIEESYSKKVEKYAELRSKLEQEFPEVEVRKRTIVVCPTGCILSQPQKEFPAPPALPRNRLAPHQRNIVDVALCAPYEHYQSFVQHLMKATNVRWLTGTYQTEDPALLEMAEDVREIQHGCGSRGRPERIAHDRRHR
jgi:hypothetical protein